MKKLLVIATVVALAFGGAGFALGVSTGARAEDGAPGAEAVTRTSLRTTSAPAASVGASAPAASAPAASAPAVQASDPAREPGTEVRPATLDQDAAPARLRVRRLVVTPAIVGHEPDGAIETMGLGEHARVYAFVELANGGGAGAVVVTFERDGAEATGHVTLDVPGQVGRWRTWAFTRGVTSAGEWRAVVRDDGGRVLAEEPFVVE